jgi:putative ABC transport system permease protein
MREDLKTAVRSLWQSPTFTGVALLVLALGIGATTAIFSVVDAVILKSLPFDEHDRLVAVLEHDTVHATTFGNGDTTPQMFLDWRAHQQPFEQVAATDTNQFQLHNETGEPVTVPAESVSWEFFPVLRVAPMLGRAFTAADEGEKPVPVVILSYGFWQRQFGGAMDVIGRRIELDDDRYEIVGVMPRGFTYPVASEKPAEIFAPISFSKEDKIKGESHNYNYLAIARLKSGVSIDQAGLQMKQLSESLDKEFPKWSPGRTTRVVSLHDRLVGKVRTWMLMLLGVVGLVLAIACANVANLMLARATVRTREIAIRAALGASRWRLIRGLMVEGLVLSGAGALLGVLLAYGGVQVLRLWLPHDVPRVASIAIDLRVLGTAFGLAMLTGLVFGCVPAWHATRPDLVNGLKDGGRSATAGSGSSRLRSALVVAEIALAVVLLVGAGLFISSFASLTRVDVGLDPHNVLTVSVRYPVPLHHPEEWAEIRKTPAKGIVFMQQMLEAIKRAPGVESVGSVNGGLPLTRSWSRSKISIAGRGELAGDEDGIDRRSISNDYLQTLRIPLTRGRYLNARDTATSQPVALINHTAAQKYWPKQDPIGQHATINKVEREIVGIVGDVRHLGPELPARPEIYLPAEQDSWFGGMLAIRTSGDPLKTLPAVKAAIWSVTPAKAFTEDDSLTLDGYMERYLAQRRFNMALLALFGIVGLVIAAAGLYGVMAYTVAQRTNEIGIRIAIGATPGNIVSMVLRQATLLTTIGLLVGAAGAWSLSSAVRAFLFDIDPTDLRVFGAALAILTIAGLVASAFPANRAARVDPLIALRRD